MTGLLGWFQGSGIVRVQLHASDDGYELYRRLGFRDAENPSMIIML